MIKFKESPSLLYKMDYTCNAPYYFSYLLDDQRQVVYYNTFGDKYGTLISCFMNGDTFVEVSATVKHHQQIYFKTFDEVNKIESVSLFSDGIYTIDDEWVNVLREMTKFKTTKGNFVLRRCRRVLSEYSKENKEPSDDFATATMILK